MRIIAKLTLAFVASTLLILAVVGALRVRRDRAFFEAERAHDHELVGRSLVATASAVWRADGELAAVDAIEAVAGHFTSPEIRWQPVGAAGTQAFNGRSPVAVDAATLDATPAGQPVTGVMRDRRGVLQWTTYVPLDVAGVRHGFIVLSEPAMHEGTFLRSTVADIVTMALSLTMIGALLSFVMGQWLVGTPVRILSEKARRVGRGDFAAPVIWKHRDELGELAVEVNRMCDKLAASLEQLRHADRLSTVGKLASGVAHELGTPLNVVGARAQMIVDGQTSLEEARDYARIIVGATGRMTKTIRQLLQFARRGRVEKSTCDLHGLLSDTLDLLRPLAEARRARLALVAGDAMPAIRIDSAQMQQVITNLVVNSIQAMPRGGLIELSIDRVVARTPAELGNRDRECLCLRVRDEGCGVAPEWLPRIFEPFFTTKDIGEGTGLGLAVSYGIVREHGGWFTVDSGVNAGTTFAVFLPLTEES